MTKRAIFAALALIATPALAQNRGLGTLWTIQPAPPPEGERALAGGEWVLKQRLLPSGLAELSAESAIAAAKLTLPAGTQLIEAGARDSTIFCWAEPTSRRMLCLVDADRDQAFEGYFIAYSTTKGLPTIQGNSPKQPKPIDPVGYRRIDPSTMRDEYFVAIERRNYFNIYGLENFMIAFGTGDRIDRITAPISFKASELPKEMTILGARFTAISQTAGKMLIKVQSAMPAQPFGIMTTTTYRFY